jgi:hypothetical protein
MNEQQNRTKPLFRAFGKLYANKQITIEDKVLVADELDPYIYKGIVVDIGRIDLTPKGNYGVEYWIVEAGYESSEDNVDLLGWDKMKRSIRVQELIQSLLDRWIHKNLYKCGLPHELPIKYFFRGWL